MRGSKEREAKRMGSVETVETNQDILYEKNIFPILKSKKIINKKEKLSHHKQEKKIELLMCLEDTG